MPVRLRRSLPTPVPSFPQVVAAWLPPAWFEASVRLPVEPSHWALPEPGDGAPVRQLTRDPSAQAIKPLTRHLRSSTGRSHDRPSRQLSLPFLHAPPTAKRDQLSG